MPDTLRNSCATGATPSPRTTGAVGSCRPRSQLLRYLQTIVCLSFLVGATQSAGGSLEKAVFAPRTFALSEHASEQLSESATSSLQRTLAAGELADLHWRQFGQFREALLAFYDSRNYQLAWIRDAQPTAQAREVMGLLQNAERKGLDPLDYDGPLWSGRLAWLRPENPQPRESDMIRFDVALTVCAMRYASDLHLGRLDPQAFGFGPGGSRRRFDVAQFLRREILNSADVPDAFEQIEPPYEGYQRTLHALETYLELARRGDATPLPEPPRPVRQGDTYAGTPRLVRLLGLVGDLPVGARVNAESLVYTASLAAAVKTFQRRHGLDPDGRIGPETLAQLNTPLRNRVRQLQLTLERWRWLPTRFDEPPIIVNIPEFVLRAMDENFQAALTMKVVVGTAVSGETPTFSARMADVVFRPYWNVPLPIQRDELLPEIERDPRFLARNSYEIVTSRGQPVEADVRKKGVREKLRSGEYLIRQVPGPRNSLGLVKFELPNRYDVYLHSTPARELFARPRRAFSHGCIRVEKPAELAEWVLRSVPDWDLAHVRAAMNGGETLRVELKQTIPVLIVYGTAIVLQNGEVQFFQDVYGHDAALEHALEARYAAAP